MSVGEHRYRWSRAVGAAESSYVTISRAVPAVREDAAYCPRLPHPQVDAVLSDKQFVAAALRDSAGLHHEDLITVDDGFEPVRHQHFCAKSL